MEIMKIFSSWDEDERLYSVLLSEDEFKLFNEYTPGVTRWDRTDKLKQMKDSDVLAEKKRSNTRSYLSAAKTGALGSMLGAGIGAATSIATKGKYKMGNATKTGALIGGLTLGGGKLAATHGEREENRFVNRRLREAKRQALRRESKDWKNNSVNREGYTFSDLGDESRRMFTEEEKNKTTSKIGKGLAIGGLAAGAYGAERVGNVIGDKLVKQVTGKRDAAGKFIKMTENQKKLRDLGVKLRDNKTIQNIIKKALKR